MFHEIEDVKTNQMILHKHFSLAVNSTELDNFLPIS